MANDSSNVERYPWIAVGLFVAASALVGCHSGRAPGAPSLTSTTITTMENAPATQQLTATDPNGATVSFAALAAPRHGTFTVSSAGFATYTPTANYFGTDSVSLTLTDSAGGKGTATLTINVTYVNIPPVAHDDQLRIPSAATTLSILANDENPNKDTLTVTILTQPQGGTVSVQNGATVSFQPDNAFAGPTSFTYRITNPQGSSSDATTHLVVGDFPGVMFISDETTIGTTELFYYDGFQTTRLNAPLPAGASIASFSQAADGVHVAFVVVSADPAQVLLADRTNPGVSRLIYTSAAALTNFQSIQVNLNRDASDALIVDPTNKSALKTLLIDATTGSQTNIAASNPGLVAQTSTFFNPATNEFYVQAQVGGSGPPVSGTGYTTLFSATTLTPDPLVQIGANYAGNIGNGSGYLIRATPDGQRILHAAVTYGSGGASWDLLVNDRRTNLETYLFRSFGALEFEVSGNESFDINADGSSVCFVLNALPANGTFSPGRVWFADPRAPGTAAAVTPQADYNFNCRWTSDGKSIVYSSATGAAPPEPWIVAAARPGTVVRLREPLPANASTEFVAVAQKSMTAIVGVRPLNSGPTEQFYRTATDTPGVSMAFYSADFNSGTPIIALDPNGTGMQLLVSEPRVAGAGVVNHLHWISTQTNNLDRVLSRADTMTGVLQAGFVPE